MFHKVKVHRDHPKGIIFAYFALLASICFAMISTIMANFVKEIYMGNEIAVSNFFTYRSILTLIGNLCVGLLLVRISSVLFFYLACILVAFTTFALYFIESSTLLVIVEFTRNSVGFFISIGITLMIKNFIDMHNISNTLGTRYAFSNIGWTIGPIIAGFISQYFGYSMVFIPAAAMIFFLIIFFSHQHLVAENPHIDHDHVMHGVDIFKNIAIFFNSKDRIIAYLIMLTYAAWFTFIYIYLPLYIINSGFGKQAIGMILAAVTVPLFLMESKIGKWSQKVGVKLPIVLGLLIVGGFMILTYIFKSNPYITISLMILANIGMAFIEPIQDLLFFEATKKEDEGKLMGIYTSAQGVGQFIMPFMAGIIIVMFGFDAIIIAIALLMFLIAGIFYIFKRENVTEAETLVTAS